MPSHLARDVPLTPATTRGATAAISCVTCDQTLVGFQQHPPAPLPSTITSQPVLVVLLHQGRWGNRQRINHGGSTQRGLGRKHPAAGAACRHRRSTNSSGGPVCTTAVISSTQRRPEIPDQGQWTHRTQSAMLCGCRWMPTSASHCPPALSRTQPASVLPGLPSAPFVGDSKKGIAGRGVAAIATVLCDVAWTGADR
jgi:hypothetical protein